jgi:hypothetical protein
VPVAGAEYHRHPEHYNINAKIGGVPGAEFLAFELGLTVNTQQFFGYVLGAGNMIGDAVDFDRRRKYETLYRL